jgi:hypothetical protein
MGIKIDRNQKEIGAVCRPLAIIEDVVVPGIVELDVAVGPQSRVVAAQAVDQPDVVLDVPRPVPVPGPDLVFLAVEIFLP